MLPVDHASGTLFVLALGNLPDPGARIPRALGNRGGRLPLGQEPEDLSRWPPTAFMRLVGRSVPLFEVLDAQMRRQMNMSTHASIVRRPSRKPYDVCPRMAEDAACARWHVMMCMFISNPYRVDILSEGAAIHQEQKRRRRSYT